MKVVYGINRWTNANRSQARHISDANNKPLCGDKKRTNRNSCTYEIEDGEPTCQKCIRLQKQELK